MHCRPTVMGFKSEPCGDTEEKNRTLGTSALQVKSKTFNKYRSLALSQNPCATRVLTKLGRLTKEL